MRSPKWYTLRDEQGDAQIVTVARQLPARFDVAVKTVLTRAEPTRVAHQIRQDMWRALQNLRGFSPVVQVHLRDGVIEVTAGGRLPKPISSRVEQKIRDVLENPKNQERWLRHANRVSRAKS